MWCRAAVKFINQLAICTVQKKGKNESTDFTLDITAIRFKYGKEQLKYKIISSLTENKTTGA